MTLFPARWLLRRRSISTQLALWNTMALALLLGSLGLIIRYAVVSTIMASVDNELFVETTPPPHMDAPGGPPSFGAPPGGPSSGPGAQPGPTTAPDSASPANLGGPPDMRGPDGGGPQGPPPGGFGLQGGPGGSGRIISGTGATIAVGLGMNGPGGPGMMPPQAGFRRQVFDAASTGRQTQTATTARTLDSFRRQPRMFTLDGRSMGPFDDFAPLDPDAIRQSATRRLIYSNIVVDGEPVRVLTRAFVHQGIVDGAIQAAYPLGDIDRAIQDVDRVLLTLIPVGLLCAALGGITLTGRVLRRVHVMTRAAGRIGARDFSERIPAAGDDEFSELADTFNSLLGRLESALLQEKKLNEQQRRFTADASHELKTPLTIIRGNTGLALAGSLPDEGAYRDSMLQIDQAAQTMSGLVSDLLLLARSDSGRLGQDPICVLAGEVIQRAATPLRGRGAPIVVRLLDESLTILGNEMELVRLHTNLLTNALRHTPEDGRITVTAHRNGRMAVISVADTGCGIAPEHLPHLGQRFYRVDSARARKDGGTGLGLAICKGIVDAHHGKMTIDSMLGSGTIVTLRLPVAE